MDISTLSPPVSERVQRLFIDNGIKQICNEQIVIEKNIETKAANGKEGDYSRGRCFGVTLKAGAAKQRFFRLKGKNYYILLTRRNTV